MAKNRNLKIQIYEYDYEYEANDILSYRDKILNNKAKFLSIQRIFLG